MMPSPSAVAQKVVEDPGATATGRPGEANWVEPPTTTGASLHWEFV